jgi:nucleoside phosphorylase
MKIMIIEDDERKKREIASHLRISGVEESEIIVARSMTDFASQLHADIGLFIIDLNIPSLDDGAASLNGRAILESIVKADKQNALLLAISSYPNEFPALRDFFESHGCILADFTNKTLWKSALNHLLIQLQKNLTFDFLIFCALPEERNPYATLVEGEHLVRSGIDCYDFDLNGRRGSVILLPRMGLVNAAITAGLCVDRFKPKVVGMSGICGGFEGRASVGQLFVSSLAYEYQSGKWSSDGFLQEPYQVATDHIALTKLKAIISTDGLISTLETGFTGTRPAEPHKPELGIFTSGSAVIADQRFIDQIKTIHRKVNALDMEVFAIHRAAELSASRPVCICAKTVVDLCNQAKHDDLHAYGSYISAKFMLLALESHLVEPASARFKARQSSRRRASLASH